MDYFPFKEVFGFSLTTHQIEKFKLYIDELKKWNEKINLTSIKNDREIILRHFLDSLAFGLVYKKFPWIKKVLDIGPGAGFPSLPIKIVLNGINLTLIETVKKKCTFLEYIIGKFRLKNVDVYCERSENLAKEEKFREVYDCVLVRALAKLNIVLELSLSFLKISGILVCWKTTKYLEELREAENVLKLLGGEFLYPLDYTIKDLCPRSLLIFKKVQPTPKEFPRKPGVPQKKPIR